MWKEVFLLATSLVVAIEGIGFPNLLNGVYLSAPPGFAPIRRSWGLCKTETKGTHGLSQSRKECVMDKLTNKWRYTEDNAEELLRIASSEVGVKHPLRLSDNISSVDEDSKKTMCSVAADCECSITLDWCKWIDEDKKKKKNKKKSKKTHKLKKPKRKGKGEKE